MIFDSNLTLLSGYDDEGALEKLKRARQGSHYNIVYRDLPTLREIYSQHTKRQVEEKKEIAFHITKPLKWLDTSYRRWLSQSIFWFFYRHCIIC